jgi:hypothetical protein
MCAVLLYLNYAHLIVCDINFARMQICTFEIHTALHVTALYVTAFHVTALHVTAIRVTALHVTALYVTVLHVTAIRVTALQVTVYSKFYVTQPILRALSLRKTRVLFYFLDKNSSVGIVIRYGLDGLGIESRWERDFPHPSRPALGLTQPPIQRVLGLSRG